jgi:hypothetical protein
MNSTATRYGPPATAVGGWLVTTSSSNAPASQAAPCGRATPRWSVASPHSAGKVDRRAARDQGVGLRRAAVVGQGRVENVGQGDIRVAARGVEVVRAGGEIVEGVGVALAAVAEDVVGVGGDRAVVVSAL